MKKLHRAIPQNTNQKGRGNQESFKVLQHEYCDKLFQQNSTILHYFEEPQKLSIKFYKDNSISQVMPHKKLGFSRN